MLRRSMASSDTAAVADSLALRTKPRSTAAEQDSSSCSDSKFLVHCEPVSPTSSADLISTAVLPSDAAAAADLSPTAKQAAFQNAASTAAAAGGIQQQHSGLAGTQPNLDKELAGSSFEQLCNDGARWSWANWRVKLYRWTLLLLKEIYLFWLAASVPTNHLMLTFRTYVRDAGEPNGNSDHLAAKFRDELMPSRGKLHRERSPLITISRRLLETPFFGIPGIVRFIDVRTQWFDDSVAAAQRDGIKQVVIIAAGYDTRAYRLSKPGVRYYEVDMPEASRRKQELVRKLLPADKFPRPEYVAADLSKVKLADALASTSFDPTQPALFTAEGLVYYLPPCAVQQMLSCIGSISAPGSRVMMDFLHLSSLSGSVWHPGFETLWISVMNKGERMLSGIDERPGAVEALMRKFGFHTHIVLTAADLVKHYMPHVQYAAKPPTVSPYFGYLSAEKL